MLQLQLVLPQKVYKLTGQQVKSAGRLNAARNGEHEVGVGVKREQLEQLEHCSCRSPSLTGNTLLTDPKTHITQKPGTWSPGEQPISKQHRDVKV